MKTKTYTFRVAVDVNPLPKVVLVHKAMIKNVDTKQEAADLVLFIQKNFPAAVSEEVERIFKAQP